MRATSISFFSFFGFDFLAEFFLFGTFGFAAFVLVDFFDLDRFVSVLAFVVIGFLFVVFVDDEGRRRGDSRQAHRVGRGGRGEQHQRGEQESQQDWKVPHGPVIGAM
jgi:hypothetical protein